MATTNASGAPVTLVGNQLTWAAQVLLDKLGEHVDELRDAYRTTATDIAESGDHGWFSGHLRELTVMQDRVAVLCRADRDGQSYAMPIEWLVGD